MKKILAILMAAAITLTAVGCGDKENSTADETKEITASAEADNDSSASDTESEAEKLDDADKTAQIGEDLRNEFFIMNVVEAYRMNSVSGYVPNDPNYEYLAVHVAVKSVFTETINVGTYDFDVVWGDTEAEMAYAIEQDDFGFDGYPYSQDLEYREMAEGNVFFLVPKDAETLYFRYVEIYEDDSVGKIYQVELKDLGYLEDPYEPAFTGAAIGDKMSTTVFDMTVNGVRTVDTVGSYTTADLEEGFKFIAVDVTIEGTAAEAVETGAYYFSVYWGEGDEEYSYALIEDDVVDMPANVDVAAGDTIRGEMFFVVPTETEFLDFYYFDLYDENLADYVVPLGNSANIA